MVIEGTDGAHRCAPTWTFSFLSDRLDRRKDALLSRARIATRGPTSQHAFGDPNQGRAVPPDQASRVADRLRAEY